MSNSSFSMDDYDNISNYRVSQTAHGFTKGQVLRTDTVAGTYALAQADSDSNAEVAGIVSEVIDANTFKLRIIGRQTGLSALVTDTVYFLSHVTPGALTTTDPATIGSGFVSKPVLLTDSTTSGMILTYRGINDGGGGDAGTLELDNISDVNAPSPSDNDILTWDSGSGKWINEAAAGGGGAWSLISTTNATAQHPIEFTGLSSTYYAYRLVFDNCTVSNDSQTLYLRTSSNNGSSYDGGGTDYQYSIEGMNSANVAAPSRNTGNASIIMHGGSIGNAANESFGGEIIIMNPSDTKYTKIFLRMNFNSSNASEINYVRGIGERKSTTAVDAFSINAFAGTFSGTFKLYGLSAT